MKRRLVLILAVAAILCSAVYLIFAVDKVSDTPFRRLFQKKYQLSVQMGDYGTAAELQGKTLCVSMFVDTNYDEWTADDDKEEWRIKLGYAADWIEQMAGEYGVDSEFIYDWNQFPELRYDVRDKAFSYSRYLENNDGYNELWNLINNDIPVNEMLSKYKADNILFVTFYNTAESNGVEAFATDGFFDKDYYYDTAFIPAYFQGRETTASVIAHEMLHLFGAADLYCIGRKDTMSYNMNQEMIDYMRENYPDDIMLRTFDHETDTPFYGEVNGSISPVTAYYIGLTSEVPEAISDFGLDLSTHDANRKSTF